jgi:hypothetical protein
LNQNGEAGVYFRHAEADSRVRRVCLAIAGPAPIARSQPQAPPAKGDATAVLAAARAALGGDAKIAGVKTFAITGRTRQVRGNNLGADRVRDSE